MKQAAPQLGWLPMAVLAVALSSVLAFLYSKTQEHDKSAHFENIALLQHLRQLDAEWQLNVLKSKLGIDQHYDALSGTLVDLNKRLEQLTAAIAIHQHDDASSLAQKSATLRQAIEQKSGLIEHFKSHNSVLRNSLMFLPTAAEDLQRSLSTARNSTAFMPLSRGVNKVLLATMEYDRAAATGRAAEIQAELNALSQSGVNLSPAVAEKLAVFGLHVRTVLSEEQTVNALLAQIAAAPTAERFNEINSALNDEQQRAVTQVQRYREYLLLFAASLITLFLYAAVRLIRSHAVINRVNEELQQANDSLEQRVGERTKELAHSLSLLNATFESSTDGIIATSITGEAVCFNTQANMMWGIPASIMQVRTNTPIALGMIAAQIKDAEQYQKRVAELRAHPEIDAFDVLELKDGRIFERYIKPQKVDGEIVGRVISFRDITERKRAEQEFEKVHRQLLDVSRQAGMAEVASSVLHNVGNVLNSVNVSAHLVAEKMKRSKVASLAKVPALLHEHAQDLAAFISNDPKGRHLPEFLTQLCEHLSSEQQAAVKELNLLCNNIDHIKEIVAMQQSYSKVAGVKEIVDVVDLIEDALNMNSGAPQHYEVKIVREFDATPLLNTEKHKILQILVNLVRNAKYACNESERIDKRVTLKVAQSGDRIKIAVIDNGVGISAENLTRIFGHGFTTRKDGHGFGLHSSALAARELGGSLRAHSDGLGRGAQFTLELPLFCEPAHA